MKTELEQNDILAIANTVAELLKPMLRAANHQNKDVLMTVAETAEYLHCSVAYVYKLTASKEIPHIKRGSKFLLFRKSHIDKWLNSLAMPAVNMSVSTLKKVRSST